MGRIQNSVGDFIRYLSILFFAQVYLLFIEAIYLCPFCGLDFFGLLRQSKY
jgi:hypothetical protein